MKKIIAPLILTSIFYTSNAQNRTVITLTCNDEKKIILADQITAIKKNTSIVFKTENLTCCPGLGLQVKIKGNIQDSITLTLPNDSIFSMTERDATLEFLCNGIKKGNGIIKSQSVIPSTITPSNSTQPNIVTVGQEGVFLSNTLRDAIKLNQFYDAKASGWQDSMYYLLKNYYGITKCPEETTYFKKEYCVVFPTSTQSNENIAISSQPKSGKIGNLSSFLSPTLVIDALGKFAAKRFKQELTISFLGKFRDTLMSEKFGELKIIFPRTYYTLASADVFNYAQFYQSLHENAQTDLYNLPENMGNLVRKYQDTIDQQTFPVVLGALDLMQTLERKQPAAITVEFLAYRDYVKPDTDYGKIVSIAGILSKHLRNWEGNSPTGWADEAKLLEMISDEDAFNFWMALLLVQEKAKLEQIKFSGSSLYKILTDSLNQPIKNQIYELITSFAAVQSAAAPLSSNSGKTDSLSRSENFANYTISVFGLLKSAAKLLKATGGTPTDKYESTIQLLTASQNLVRFAHKKRFGDAISVTLEILRLINPCPVDSIIANSQCSKIIGLIDKYGNLLVSCANAKTSDELLEILERAAAPVESYRRKRGAGHFTAAINIYPGLSFGYESDETDPSKTQGGFVTAFTAPLGIGLDWGTGERGSFSIFASILDIGAVTAFRLQDSVSVLPELAWKNVFAPGAYLMWGIGRTPLSFGAGVQYGPALRKVETANGPVIEKSRLRFGISLTVDVPLFFIHSGTRKKIKNN